MDSALTIDTSRNAQLNGLIVLVVVLMFAAPELEALTRALGRVHLNVEQLLVCLLAAVVLFVL